MMRIGIFDPYLDTLSGGEKYMLSIASCLVQEYEVFIFLFVIHSIISMASKIEQLEKREPPIL